MDPTIIAIVLIVFALLVGGLGLFMMFGLAGFVFFRRRGGKSEPAPEPAKPEAPAPAPDAAAPAAPTPAPISSAPPDPGGFDEPTGVMDKAGADFQTDEGGATEVFNRSDHGRLMGWDDEEEEEDSDAGATELFTKDQLRAQYADLLDEDDDDDDDDSDGGDLPGKIVAE